MDMLNPTIELISMNNSYSNCWSKDSSCIPNDDLGCIPDDIRGCGPDDGCFPREDCSPDDSCNPDDNEGCSPCD